MKNVAHTFVARSGRAKARLPFKRLWHDNTRRNQVARCNGIQTQGCEAEGVELYRQARARWEKMPEAQRNAIVLPSAHVFAALVGLIRALALLTRDPILAIELSAAEYAERLGYSRSTIQAALRWLCSEPIYVWRVWAADGLGVLVREKRFAKGLFGDTVAVASRTSLVRVSTDGRVLLRLFPKAFKPEEKTRRKRQRKSKSQRACEEYRKKVTRAPTVVDEGDRDADHQRLVCLRPKCNSQDERAAVLEALQYSKHAAKWVKPVAANFVFPNEAEFRWFNETQQTKFFELVEMMQLEQQERVPVHLKRISS